MVLIWARVRSLMYLPTYGYIGSPGVTGAVSWHFWALICRSWLTTTFSSLVTWVSSSRVVTPRRMALANPSSDSSVVMPFPPRWACRSNWVFWGSTPGPPATDAWAVAGTASVGTTARLARTWRRDIETSAPSGSQHDDAR